MELAVKKIISISSKRQITIPQSIFNSLGFSTKADCTVQNGGIFIKPLDFNDSVDDFSTEILEDLIKQGYTGNDLLKEFKAQKLKLRSAVKKMIKDADKAVYDDSTKASFDELFG